MNRLLRIVLLASLLAATAMITACGDDESQLTGDCFSCKCNPNYCNQPYDLTLRDHVLNNIEAAYNKRHITWYEGVLDQNFTFFLSTGDVNNGLPVSWNRPDEIAINTALFDQNNTTLPCQSIFMDIRAEDGVSWIEITPESAPTETWFQATLHYDFKFEIAPNTYLPAQGAQAVFTVRDAGKFGKYDHHWQLVEMRDLGSEAMVSAPTTASATQETTWGQVKSLYR